MVYFSILIVTKNPGKGLYTTLNSVLSQDFCDYEIIIKDNSETDFPVPSDCKIRFVKSEDKGIFDAMNQAISLAKGRFVFFLNSGDRFFDRCLLGDIYNLTNHRRANFVWGPVMRQGRIHGYPKTLLGLRVFVAYKTICHQSFFVDRTWCDEDMYFNVRYSVAADYDFLLRVLMRSGIKAANHAGVIALYEGGGFSESLINYKKMVKEFYEIRYLRLGLWSVFLYYTYRTLTLIKIRRMFKLLLN